MEYRKDIINLYNSDEYQRLKAYYSKRSTLDILGVARSELAHSNMLAWLLDPKETHGLGLFPIRKFLHLLVMAKLELSDNASDSADSTACFDRNLMDSILTNSCVVESADVEAEKSVDSTGDKHKDSRIDIYIEVRVKMSKIDKDTKVLPIVIENKVDSKEHDNQTESYYKWIVGHINANKNTFINPLCVFLTPQKTLSLNGDKYYGAVPCSCKRYIRINYQYVVDHLIEQCLKQDLNEDVRRILKDYLRSLTYTYIKGDINEGGSYMAIGEEERKLLSQFWENNKNLLLAVLDAVFEDPDTSEEDRKKYRETRETLSSRDMTKYKIEGIDGPALGKGKMVLAVVKKYCSDHPDITYEELKEKFPAEQFPQSFGMIVTEEERRDKNRPIKRYFDGEGDVITLKGNIRVFVCSNWGKGNIEPFIKWVETKLDFKIIPVKE